MKIAIIVPPASGKAPISKIRVLLADDHPFVRAGVRSWLDRHDGIQVVGEASCGREAIAQAREFQPDVIVMDLSMPGVNGLQATQVLQEICPQTRVLFLTLHENKEYVRDMIEAGGRGCVRKDTSPRELILAIEGIHRGETFFMPEVAETFFNEYVLSGGRIEDSRPQKLSPRETEVLSGIVEGLANKEIADRMKIRLRTVEKHRQRIMTKLGIHKATELVKFAITRGMVNADLLKAV